MDSGTDRYQTGPAVQAPAEQDDDVAAWAIRRGAGTEVWYAAPVRGDRLVTAWGEWAMADGRRYADLTFREYRAMRACRN